MPGRTGQQRKPLTLSVRLCKGSSHARFPRCQTMAKTLRETLHAKSFSLANSESQELIARILGYRDWNVLAARIKASQSPATSVQPTAPNRLGEPIPLIPMRDMVLFPHMISRIFVARDKTRQAVEHAISGDRSVVVIAQRNRLDDRPSTLDSIYQTGVIASVVDRQTQVDRSLKVTVCGMRRASIARLTDGEFLAAEVEPLKEQGNQSQRATALSSEVLDAYQTYA